ncbi:hypothetical protein ACF073_02235 [Streptomyces sp. NPDC015171]|uniref:hypothetical protein n=1 Tax=Streptomyces sp. NPDC015171 TaxID=3364945 RepID=UPI0036F9054A
MTPISARSGAEREREPGVRRGRHRKPRPRKVLLTAGGLALAAGVLGLVRVAPDSGMGTPGTAEAEPRLAQGSGASDRPANTAATLAASPTALPSATAVMGGRSLTPQPPGSTPATRPPGTAAPTAIPTGAPGTPARTPRPAPTPATPRPRPPAPAPSRTPAPDHGTPKPDQGGLCVPVIGLCVDVFDD